jgi:hypothetical protein
LDETEKYVLRIAKEVNPNMAIEVRDLILMRRELVIQTKGIIEIPG